MQMYSTPAKTKWICLPYGTVPPFLILQPAMEEHKIINMTTNNCQETQVLFSNKATGQEFPCTLVFAAHHDFTIAKADAEFILAKGMLHPNFFIMGMCLDGSWDTLGYNDLIIDKAGRIGFPENFYFGFELEVRITEDDYPIRFE
jgi:hypothetical protein